jgi:hypothetical protein
MTAWQILNWIPVQSAAERVVGVCWCNVPATAS